MKRFLEWNNEAPFAIPTSQRLIAVRFPLLMFFCALLMRWWFYFQNGAVLTPDSFGRYLTLANGSFLRWHADPITMPGYPAFLSLIRSITHEDFPLFALQGTLGALECVFTWQIARRLGLGRLAAIPTIYMALSPAHILFANAVLSETLFSFFTTLLIRDLLHMEKEAHWSWFLRLGLVAGAAALVRSNGLVAIPIAIVILILTPLNTSYARRLVLFGASAILILAPRVYLNHKEHHFLGLARGGGYQLLYNTAYHGLLDPATLGTEQTLYEDHNSMPNVRAARLDGLDARGRKEEGDRFAALARQNILSHFPGYLLAVFKSVDPSKREVKDLTRIVKKSEVWETYRQRAVDGGYGEYVKSADPKAFFNKIFLLLRSLWILPGKYAILILFLLPALWRAVKDRSLPLLTLIALPAASFLALALMINPISRLYLPFEPLMFTGAVAVWLQFREKRKNA